MSNEKSSDIDDESMVSQDIATDVAELKTLLENNAQDMKEIKTMVNHINTYVAWQKIFAWLKLIIIIIPLTIGLIYLPPLVREAYQKILSILSANMIQ
ncbi:MAG: hypothetical protein RBT30_00255 [Patescibacteria group bacterium]|jgi:hypothetical protein|nr:hypothetical protein [Patescibacteria group bacterium]